MRFAEADNGGGHLIDAYGVDGISIGGRCFTRGLIVTPSRVQEGWGPPHAADLTLRHMDELLGFEPAANVQIVVVGTGGAQVFPDPACFAAAVERGIGIEIMDTGAACRTYNILMSEGRRVVAGLLPWGA
jgi:uncharacterized protein